MVEAMGDIRTIAAVCELPAKREAALIGCCEDLMHKLLDRRKVDKSMRSGFEIRLVDKPDTTCVTFKTVGKPLQIEPDWDDSDYSIDYKYMYGVNVTYLEFQK